MSKDKLRLLSPLFLKYQNDFEKNPRSRVFAPLAEAYRKLGMTEKAMEILSQGIRFHPAYVMGYLGLAFCYFDLKQFNLAYTTLRPHTESNRDNLRLLKLFSDICLELNKQEEALETLKYLLFINPRDKDIAELVARVESEIEERFRPNHKPIIIPERELTSEDDLQKPSAFFDLKKLEDNQEVRENDFDDWMTIDLSHEIKTEKTSLEVTKETPLINYDQWNIKKNEETRLDDDREIYKVKLDFDNDLSDEDESESESKNAPLVTHTLVDLYCGQGHIEKALEVLEKILLLNPNDQKTIGKIKEIKALLPDEELFKIESNIKSDTESNKELMNVEDLNDFIDTSEEDGRRQLMNLIDRKIGPIENSMERAHAKNLNLVEEKLTLFLKKIQKRALDYQTRI